MAGINAPAGKYLCVHLQIREPGDRDCHYPGNANVSAAPRIDVAVLFCNCDARYTRVSQVPLRDHSLILSLLAEVLLVARALSTVHQYNDRLLCV